MLEKLPKQRDDVMQTAGGKKKSLALPCLAIWLALSVYGCAYMNVKTPFDLNLDKTELGTKKGVAEAYGLLWLFAWGDASYAKAAENGHITVLRHADQEIFQILFGVYTRWRVVVYGD
jgi:TRL-like protein family